MKFNLGGWEGGWVGWGWVGGLVGGEWGVSGRVGGLVGVVGGMGIEPISCGIRFSLRVIRLNSCEIRLNSCVIRFNLRIIKLVRFPGTPKSMLNKPQMEPGIMRRCKQNLKYGSREKHVKHVTNRLVNIQKKTLGQVNPK
jgi:hypothetical protein